VGKREERDVSDMFIRMWGGDVSAGGEGFDEEERGKGQERLTLVKPSFAQGFMLRA
jgi:hypothetical protein